LMVWIGARPNDVLDRLRASVESLQETVTAKRLAVAEKAARP
jgi:hypothetical protein